MSANPCRVLLLAHDREINSSLAEVLVASGYEVIMTFDGSTAFETAESFQPDVCLVDLNAPRLDLSDLTRSLREQLERSPRLANITPFVDRDDWDTDAEFDLDFSKPSDPYVVVEQLSNFLRNESSGTGKKRQNVSRHDGPAPEPRSSRLNVSRHYRIADVH